MGRRLLNFNPYPTYSPVPLSCCDGWRRGEEMTMNCTLCNQPVTFLNKLAVTLAMKSGVICDDCRRNGHKWTRRSYADYLKSSHWKAFRAKALKHYASKCYLCGCECRPELHHNDYSRLGGELISDVIPLCRDCHQGYEDWKL